MSFMGVIIMDVVDMEAPLMLLMRKDINTFKLL
jgi:hypothetical protein